VALFRRPFNLVGYPVSTREIRSTRTGRALPKVMLRSRRLA